MTIDSTMPEVARSFEEALLHGEARGYAVCVKALRFARLPDTVATTFAEIGDENCYYVFESEAEAHRRLGQVSAEDRLGWLHSVREIVYLASMGKNDGPKLDIFGHPFGMRGFIVASSGAVTEWRQPGRLGWRGPTMDGPAVKSEQPASGLIAKIMSWLRSLLGKKRLTRKVV